MKTRISRICIPFIATALFVSPALAGSATWRALPATGDWNTAGNWSPATVPNGSADTASFISSTITGVSISANTEVNSIVFENLASAYTITANPTFTLTISGVGITNNSGITQNFVTAVDLSANSGLIVFTNSATAGSNTVFTNNGATVNGGFGGVTQFFNTSTAGSATITTNGGAASGAGGGFTQFFNTSTAGSGTFTTNGGTMSGAFGGKTEFHDSSSAGSGTFVTNGDTLSGTLSNAGTVFFDTSTAANGTFTTNGGTVSGASGGFTQFNGSSSAGSGTFTTNGGTANGAFGGLTEFDFTSSASSGTFTTNGGTMSGAFGGLTRFIDSSTAGNATITNNGSTNADGGDTAFNDTSTAGSATITNNSSQGSGGGAGITEFNGTADAGSASITNLGGAFLSNGGETHFHDTSSAANANITNNGGASLTGVGGTKFTSSSTAGSATITNNGGSGLGASGGFTYFLDTSTASSATLIANGGTTSGDGGLILISNDATGGTARVEVFGNGELDISTHNSTSAVTVGSIEGSGNVFLGANSLAVGSNNMTTTFSGVIQDGGMGGGMGGSLDKIGSGTLTLSGTNTYTGDTLALVGSLLVDGSIASPVTFVIDGGLLGGNGIIGGDVQVNDAGVVSPGDSLGTLTVNGNYSQGFAGILRIEIGGLNSGVTSDLLNVNGAAGSSLGGTLQLVRINNFTPLPGDRVTIINDPNGHMGMFATVTSNFTGLTQPMPMYDEATDVYVVFELSATFESQGLTRNQMSVGEAVDDVVGDSRASALIAFLGNEPMGNLPHDFDLIAPEELASIYEIGFSQAVVTNMNLQHRMDDIRAGSTGFCANGYQAQETGGYSKESDGKVALDKNPTPAFVPSPENRWGIFATGSGDFVNVGDHDLNAHGYDITTGNVIVGVDYRVCDHFAVGIDGSYAGSTADLVDRGRVEVDGGKAGAYATVFGYKILGSVIHIDGAVSGGWNSYDTHRTGLEDLPVLGSTNGSELNAMLAYGGDWHFGCLLIGTWSSLQYTNVNIDSFTETGSLAPLHIESQDEYSLRGTTGLRMAYDFKAGRAIIRPEVRAAYQHEYGDRAYPIDASLASGAGDVFTVHGPAIGRDSALVDAGFAVQWSNRISTYVYYDGVFGRTNYENNAVSGGLRVSF